MTWIVLGGVWVSAAYSLVVDDPMRAAIQVSLAAGVTIGWVAANMLARAALARPHDAAKEGDAHG